MNDIATISKTFFGLCVGAFIGLVIYLVVALVIYKPPLFIPPTETESQSLEKALSESTNIEGLQEICATFARCEDRLNAFEKYHFNQIEYFMSHFVLALFAVVILFGFGFWRIWQLTKKSTKNETDAL